jgi:DNA primase
MIWNWPWRTWPNNFEENIMDLKYDAAGRKPAASSKNITASNSKAHHTTNFNPLNLDLLLSRVNLVELVEHAGAKIHRSGYEIRCACPLHKGDNPTAFSVYKGDDGHEHWHCHTKCATGGDAIDFVQRWRGLDFMGAVKYLAEYTRLHLEELGYSSQSIQAETVRRKSSDVFDEAARYFASQLWGEAGQQARAYLLERGLTEQTLHESNWGFTRSDHSLLQHLQKAGVNIVLAKELGLVRSDGLDFTANANGKNASPDGYIIYPHMWNGRIAYFSARALNPIDADDKSRNLPGERQVYWALVPGDPNLIIVEGQADAESLRQVGRSALALCGVGNLPVYEIERIRKRRTVYLALDNDPLKPGLSALEQDKIRKRKADATKRLCDSLGALTMVVSDLPFKDCNEWLQQGMNLLTLEKHLSIAKPWLELLIEESRSIPPVELDEALQSIAKTLSELPEALQSRYFSQIEKRLNLSRRDIKRLMNQ